MTSRNATRGRMTPTLTAADLRRLRRCWSSRNFDGNVQNERLYQFASRLINRLDREAAAAKRKAGV